MVGLYTFVQFIFTLLIGQMSEAGLNTGRMTRVQDGCIISEKQFDTEHRPITVGIIWQNTGRNWTSSLLEGYVIVTRIL